MADKKKKSNMMVVDAVLTIGGNCDSTKKLLDKVIAGSAQDISLADCKAIMDAMCRANSAAIALFNWRHKRTKFGD